MEQSEKHTNKNRPFFSCLASSLSVLMGLSLFLTSPQVGKAMADTDSGEEPFLIIQDSDGKKWTELDGLSVFENDQFGGKAIVAPGSEGSYDFTVQNNADFPLKFEILFGEDNEYGVPLEYRLRSEDGYLSEDWTPAGSLDGIEEELEHESDAGYTLEWRWIFDGDDERDTAIGRAAAEHGVDYTLKLKYGAEQTGEPVKPGEPVNPGQTDSPQTGDSSMLPFWAALLLCSATAIPLTLILRRKCDNEEE